MTDDEAEKFRFYEWTAPARHLGSDAPNSLEQFINNSMSVSPLPLNMNTKCRECNIPLAVPGCDYCTVCDAMLEAVYKPHFVKHHQEWHQENLRRIKAKNAMLAE